MGPLYLLSVTRFCPDVRMAWWVARSVRARFRERSIIASAWLPTILNHILKEPVRRLLPLFCRQFFAGGATSVAAKLDWDSPQSFNNQDIQPQFGPWLSAENGLTCCETELASAITARYQWIPGKTVLCVKVQASLGTWSLSYQSWWCYWATFYS